MNWRRIILIGLIILFSTVVLTHFVAATELVSTLQRGQPLWVMVALALELLWLLNQTALYQSLYVLMQLPAYMSQMLPIVLASNFINFAAPSACLGGIALFRSGWSCGCYIRQPWSANSQSHCCCASLSRIELLVAPAQQVRCHPLGQVLKSVSGVT